MWQRITRSTVARQLYTLAVSNTLTLLGSLTNHFVGKKGYKKLEGSDPPALLGSSCQLLATEPTEPLSADTLAKLRRARRRPPRPRPLLLSQPVSMF